MEFLNQNIFFALNNLSGKNTILDSLLINLSEYTPYIFLFLLIFLWFKNEKLRNIVLYSGYSVIIGLFFNFIISKFYFHARPFADGLGNNIVEHIADSSFPSDHTTFMLAIAFQLVLHKQTRNIGFFTIFLGIISGFSRVFVGVHYPFDIFGAVLISVISTFLIHKFRNKFKFLNDFILRTYKFILSKISLIQK